MARPTKNSAKLRTAISSVLGAKLSAREIERLLEKVEREDGAKAALQAYALLMDYVLPKLARVEHTGGDGEALSVNHILKSVSSAGNSSDIIDGGMVKEVDNFPEVGQISSTSSPNDTTIDAQLDEREHVLIEQKENTAPLKDAMPLGMSIPEK